MLELSDLKKDTADKFNPLQPFPFFKCEKIREEICSFPQTLDFGFGGKPGRGLNSPTAPIPGR
jgi:hypothetical protein